MDHHVARDLLGAYVDDELEPPTRAALEAHLADCDDCRALLPDSVTAPGSVDLAQDPAPVSWDERRMRRAVRVTLVRTTVGAALAAVAILLVLGLVSDLVLRPIAARGDRLEQAIQLTWDVPLLFTPGAYVSDFTKEPSGGTTTIDAQISRHVGGLLGGYQVELTAWAMTAPAAPDPPFLHFDGPIGRHPTWQADRVPEGTVATVQLSWLEPITMAAAEALLGPDVDASLVWAAFAIGPLRGAGLMGPVAWDPSTDVGYSTCSILTEERLETLADPRRGGSGSGTGLPIGLAGALEQARRATANLAAADDFLATLRTDAPVILRIDETAAWLADNEPPLTSVVITGPTDVIAEAIANADADDARLLGMDFYNWEDPMC
jgi:hypothetical protein